MAFLYLHSCDVRRQGLLHLLVTESQDKLPQLMPKPWAALPLPYEQPAEMKLCTHLGDFCISPHSGISDAGYIQNFHFLQQNKDKEDEERQRRKERNTLQRPPEAAKQVLASTLYWGRAFPPGTTQAGKYQLLIGKAGRLASVEAVVVCSTILFRVRPEARCRLP